MRLYSGDVIEKQETSVREFVVLLRSVPVAVDFRWVERCEIWRGNAKAVRILGIVDGHFQTRPPTVNSMFYGKL